MSPSLHRHRRLRTVIAPERPDASMQIEVEGKRYINFSSNDYFGLSQHSSVIDAAKMALERYGTGAGASRLVTGNSSLYDTLETQLAQMKGTETALVFGSGYLANLGVIQALIGRHDLVLADKLAHACMLDGARLSGAKLRRFVHNDIEALEDALKQCRATCQDQKLFILTETIFSMDGDRAPIESMLGLCERYDATLLSDDAHGLGLVPCYPHPRHIQLGTLSKGAGAYGGYVCGSAALRDQLVNEARSLIFSTALPPATLAAASEALRLIEQGDVVARLKENIELWEKGGEVSPIHPVIIGSDEAALKAQATLAEAGFWVSAIRPPTVPEGTSRLRVTISAAHHADDITTLSRLLQELQCS